MAALEKEFYTGKELAELLSVSLKTVSRIIDRGEISYHAIGRIKRFRREDVEEYLGRIHRKREDGE